MAQNKEQYRKLCTEKSIPLFMQAWWLDAVCIEKFDWDVLFYKKNENILGVLPYCFCKKYGFKIIEQPNRTQYNGVWIDYPQEQKLHKRYSFEKKVMDNLIAQLENLKISFYSQNFHHSFTNWQPFYWKGFKQTTRYTYRITDLSDLEKVFNAFSAAKQRHIKKENADLVVDFSVSAEEFYDFHKKCLETKNAKMEYSQKLFYSIYNEAIKCKQGKIIALKNAKKIHSAIFVVWDKNSAYALNYAINPALKNDGASTKMFWEAIKYVADKTQAFDFEGSMIESVAQSYLQFGGEQTPYFRIEKSYSKLLLGLKFLKNIF
ncbi:MAG: hypothetical protein LBN95_05745 [Prevotellaceae bacterium]|jgi:hypothetical protein|nr:hypothetical protein [Prevotellaceae bacterium]